MRLIVMSDIHGNLTALDAVAASLPPADRVIVAGDLCLEGPRPAETWDRLQELGWELIMGNTDRDIVENPPSVKSHARDVIAWTRQQLGADRIAGLKQLPFSRRAGPDKTVLAVHANPKTMDQHLRPDMTPDELRPFLEGVEAEIIAFGHLHTPYIRPVGGYVLVDVSSVGHPKDRDLRASYTIFEWDGLRRSITNIRVPYDVEKTVHELRTCGMPHGDKEAESLLKASY